MPLYNIETVTIYATYPVDDAKKLDLDDHVSKVITRNELSYNASPSRSNDMTLRNDEEAFYVPTIEFEINYLTPDLYAKLMQFANSKGFIARYMDQEMQEPVHRSMYMTEQSIDNLIYGMSSAVDGVTSVKVKMVSKYGYPYVMASDSANFNEATKYHYGQLHAHRGPTDFRPDGVEEQESYV